MKKHLFSLAIIFFSISNYCSAQVTFQKSYGGALPDWGNSVKQTSDGGYIVAGTTMSVSTFEYQAYLIKTNANGDLTWKKTFFSFAQYGQDVQQTNDGGYILLCAVNDAGANLLIKTDAAGDTLWTRHLRGVIASGYSIKQTSDNGYIIVGEKGDHMTGIIDTINALLLKTNPVGEMLWSKTYGGLKRDEGYSVQQTNDNGYILTGYETSFGTDSSDVYLVKTDAGGDTLWTRRYGGPRNDKGIGVKQTGDNGYVIVGTTNSFGAGGNDIYLIKIKNNGEILWSKTYGGSGQEIASGIQVTADGGYIISGATNSFSANGTYLTYLIKTDNLGNVEWSKTINMDNAGSIQQTGDGGYVIPGQVTTNTDINVLLTKIDMSGNSVCNQTDVATITNTVATKMSGTTTLVASKFFTIETRYPLYVGSAGTETTLCTSVGLNEIKSNLPLLISPNPSSGDFVITFPGIINQGTIEIYTVLGERVFSKAISLSTNIEINLVNNPPGIYFVKVLDGERRYSLKIMIEK